MKNLTPRNLALLAAAVIGVVAIAGWFGVVSPQRSKAESLEARIADQKTKLTLAQVLARSQQSGTADTTGTRVLLKAMPTTLQMPSVLRQVRRLAASSKVTVESFTPSAATPAAGYDAVPIELSVTGRYAKVQSFLHGLRVQAGASGGRIHATGRLFDVQKVDLTPGGDGAPELSASIRLATFVYTGTPLPAADAVAITDSEEAA